jgi:hypothetical protein
MVDYILHALNGRLNARGEASLLEGVKIESAKTHIRIQSSELSIEYIYMVFARGYENLALL